MSNFLKTYTTPRLLQANNSRLQMCYLLQLGIIVILFALYAMVYHQAHQHRCPARGVTTLKTFGGFYLGEDKEELIEKYPRIIRRFWSSSDIIERSDDGFTVLTNIVITPNQTQTTCPESPVVPNSICTDKPEKVGSNFSYTECVKGEQSASGILTGECVYNSLEQLKFYDIQWGEPGTMTCEVEGWCPLLPFSKKLTHSQNSEGTMLELSKNLIVMLKTAADFPLCGDDYFGTQETSEGKPDCAYHPINNPSCPWLTIHDLVLYAGFISYENVASTGQIFRVTVNWDCDFDWKKFCVPTYSISPVSSRSREWESFYREEPIYHSVGTRTLVRKYGLKFIIEHHGEGRKTTFWLLMKTFSLGFPYLFIPGFIITLLYNRFFKNIRKFQHKKYYQYNEDEQSETLLHIDPEKLEIRSKVV